MTALLCHTGESASYCEIGILESIFQPANQVGDTVTKNYFRIKLSFVGNWEHMKSTCRLVSRAPYRYGESYRYNTGMVLVCVFF